MTWPCNTVISTENTSPAFPFARPHRIRRAKLYSTLKAFPGRAASFVYTHLTTAADFIRFATSLVPHYRRITNARSLRHRTAPVSTFVCRRRPKSFIQTDIFKNNVHSWRRGKTPALVYSRYWVIVMVCCQKFFLKKINAITISSY